MPVIGPFEIIFLLIFWILPSFLVAKYAARKGHSFGVFLFLGLVTSFVVSLVVSLIFTNPSNGDNSDLDRIAKLSELNRNGAITDDEFAAQKAQLLDPPAATS